MRSAYPQTRFRIHRENCGLSQSELAAESGVPLRQIQLFEQRQRVINKTAAETLLQLSKALYWNMEVRENRRELEQVMDSAIEAATQETDKQQLVAESPVQEKKRDQEQQ